MDFQDMKAFMNYLTSWRIPGCTCSVFNDHEQVFAYSSGYSCRETETKMTGSELMYMYSASKVVTATAGMQLVERGLMHLNDPLEYYMSEFSNMNVREILPDGGENIRPAKSSILVRDLFSMTAGFDYNTNTPSVRRVLEETDGHCPTVAFAKSYANEPLGFDPGTHWNYSVCHDILGGLIEIVSGVRFGEYVRKNIFEPCGMNDSAYGLRDGSLDRMASQYCFDDEKCIAVADEPPKNYFLLGDELESGGAGIVSTVSDFARFADALSCGGVSASGERVLAPSSVKLMSTNCLSGEALADYNWEALRGYGYGLGVRTHIDRSRSGSLSPLGEFGWTGAAGAFLVSDPENRLSMFYAHHMMNNQETFTTPRLRNLLYHCFEK